jgi:hypothetical protein
MEICSWILHSLGWLKVSEFSGATIELPKSANNTQHNEKNPHNSTKEKAS